MEVSAACHSDSNQKTSRVFRIINFSLYRTLLLVNVIIGGIKMDNLDEKEKKKVILRIAICVGLLIALMIVGILM